MKFKVISSLPWLAIAALLLGVVNAQEAGKKEEKKKFLRMNIVPLGDNALPGTRIINNFPVVIMPKPTELVPDPIYIKEGKEYKSMTLAMNSPSRAWSRPAGSQIDILTMNAGQFSSYVSAEMPPEKEDVTLFMLRGKGSKGWMGTPRTVIFKNGVESFPLGCVRVINFSSVPVQAEIGSHKITVPPQTFKIVTNLEQQAGGIMVAYAIKVNIRGMDLTLGNSAISFDNKSRLNMVAYDRDRRSEFKQEGDDRPVKLVKYFELPYQPPPDDPDTPAAKTDAPAP